METSIFYFLIGIAVAFSTIMLDRQKTFTARALLFTGTLVFWPLFAPFIYGGRRREEQPSEVAASTGSPLDRRIASTEAELITSMQRLRGVGETVLAPELDRVRKLAVALHGMAKRLGEMDRLLEAPEFSATRAEALLAELEAKVSDRDDARVASVRARLRNIERLRAIRGKTADDLERALYKMEEMSSQMIILELAGGAQAEVVESIRELALTIDAAVEAAG